MTADEHPIPPGTLYFGPNRRVIAAPGPGEYRWRVIRHRDYLFDTPQWEVPDLSRYVSEFDLPFTDPS